VRISSRIWEKRRTFSKIWKRKDKKGICLSSERCTARRLKVKG